MVRVRIDDIDELYRVAAELAAGSARVGHQGVQVLRKSAHDIEGTAKTLCRVDTGATRNSIGVDFGGNGREVTADIGPTTEYAPFLEFGTERMGPFPFMGPALERHGPAFAAAIEAISDPLP